MQSSTKSFGKICVYSGKSFRPFLRFFNNLRRGQVPVNNKLLFLKFILSQNVCPISKMIYFRCCSVTGFVEISSCIHTHICVRLRKSTCVLSNVQQLSDKNKIKKSYIHTTVQFTPIRQTHVSQLTNSKT